MNHQPEVFIAEQNMLAQPNKLNCVPVKHVWLCGNLGFLCAVCTELGSLLYHTEQLYVSSAPWWLNVALALWLPILTFLYGVAIFRFMRFLSDSSCSDPAERRAFPLKIFFVRVLVLLLCWLPYLLLSLPGTVHGDYIVQMLQVFGNRPLDSHHPYLTTQLFGSLYHIGSNLTGRPDGAVLFTVLIQAVMLAVTLSFCITALEARGAQNTLCKYAVLFFAITPIFPMFAFDCVKDTVAVTVLAFFLTQLCCRYYGSSMADNVSWWYSTPAIVFLAVFCSLLRNNFSYCIIPALFVVQLQTRGWRNAAISCLCAGLALFVWGSLVLGYLGVAKGNVREVLSVPMQQVAYYLKCHADDVTPEERDSIQNLIAVDIDELPERYTFRISDPVKSLFNIEGKRQLLEFFKVWFSLGLRHPRCYLTAFLHGNFGYWYPYLSFEDVKWANPLSVSPEDYIASLKNQLKLDFSGQASELLSISAWDRQTRDGFRDIITAFGKTPPMTLLFEPGLFIWIAMLTNSWLAYERRQVATFVLCFMLFLTCCASPDFSNMRYALPFFVMAPLLIVYSSSCGPKPVQRGHHLKA